MKKIIIILLILCIFIPSLFANEPEIENVITVLKDGVLNVISSDIKLSELNVEGFEIYEVYENDIYSINMFFNRTDVNDLIQALSAKSWHSNILSQAKGLVNPLANAISGDLDSTSFEEGEFILDGNVSLNINATTSNWLQDLIFGNLPNFKADIGLSLLLSGNNFFPILLQGEIEIYPQNDLIYIQVKELVYNFIDCGQLLFKVNYEGEIVW